MPKLLYIEASPRKSRSKSIEVAKAFLDTIRNATPSVEVDTLDLWSAELPRFDGSVVEAKYAILHGQPHTTEQAQAWRHVEDVIARFKAPDWYLFSLPMWNFGLPYVLKHYIDVLVQPGLTFSYSPSEGYSGLVTGKKPRPFMPAAAPTVPALEPEITICKARRLSESSALSASRI